MGRHRKIIPIIDDNKSKPYRWTRQAALCYYIGSVCSRCDIPADLIPKCRMRETIIELVRKFEKPPEKFIEMIRKELSGDKIPADSYILDD